MREIDKPVFGGEGGLVDPDFLPSGLLHELASIVRKHPRNKWSEDQIGAFIERCVSAANMVDSMEEDCSTGEARDLLHLIAEKAEQLLDALQSLPDVVDDALSSTHAELSLVRRPEVLLRSRLASKIGAYRRSFLGDAWDTVDDLRAVASLCAVRFDGAVSKGNKVSTIKSKRLIWFVAKACQDITGKLPPKSKESWFPVFMEKLAECESLRLKRGGRLVCGAALVCMVVSEMESAHG